MIKNILSGISAYAGSFGLISQLKLWKYFIIPIVISVVTATIIGFTAYGLSDNIGAFLAKIWIWDWGKETFTTITSVIGGLFVLVIGFLLYKHIVMALSAPFMSPVSEKIEIHIIGDLKHNHRKTSFQEQLIRGIRISLRNISKELMLTIPLLLLSFIPLIGIVFTALLFLLQAYYVGFGNMDYTLERHFNYKDSINFVGKKKGFAIGNGIVFMMCMLIPVIGIIIVLPLSVTAASVKTVALLNTENSK
ncbi:EI24 domain-containing protein [Polaribacter undariae]|uniref:EI24 domain-containing protein n=1 Tax=Polaribacter sejongensis TaxID=985043 RepID=A0AAJ1QVR1_9FLAO|nr:EI24 domain-containing protein [Polaribacter undariae]MDN3619015.1 EI24 domain-containing protein [Polaribacter undariae]UWD33101.1 EI24 domain-containing protein [Polaribacter undariae]